MSEKADIVETTFAALEVDRNVRHAHSRLDQLEQRIAELFEKFEQLESERDRLDRAIEGIACDLDNHVTSSEHCRFEPMRACFGCAGLKERVAALEARAEPAKHEPEHKVMLSQVRDTHRELAALKEQLRWRRWPEEQPDILENEVEVVARSGRAILRKGAFTAWEVTHWRPLVGAGPEESCSRVGAGPEESCSRFAPCPWCADTAFYLQDRIAQEKELSVCCCNCHARLSTYAEDVESQQEELKRRWNKRPIEDALRADVAELAKLKEQLRWRRWPEEKPEGRGHEFMYEVVFRKGDGKQCRRYWYGEDSHWQDVAYWRLQLPGPEES